MDYWHCHQSHFNYLPISLTSVQLDNLLYNLVVASFVEVSNNYMLYE